MPALSTTAKFILAALTALLIAFAVWWLYSTWTAKPKAEAKLRGNQVEAVGESGKDAVATVGQRGDKETDLDRKVSDANSKVQSATDAAGADRAGADGLCGISGDLCRK